MKTISFFTHLKKNKTKNKKTKRNQVRENTLTKKTKDEKKLGSILVEAEVGRLRIHNGTDQVTFGSEKPWGWDIV